MIHDSKMQTLEIGNIAGDMKRHDLALAILQHLITLKKTFEQKPTLEGPISFAHDVLIGAELLHFYRQIADALPFSIRKAADRFQSQDEAI
jgi:hypothetical protein